MNVLVPSVLFLGLLFNGLFVNAQKKVAPPKISDLKLPEAPPAPIAHPLFSKVSELPVPPTPPTPPIFESDSQIILWYNKDSDIHYPGGNIEWTKFLNNNLRYPEEALQNKIQGTVKLQFSVDKKGFVTDIKGLSGPDILLEEAIRVVKLSGKWVPAVKDGKNVDGVKMLPIQFFLSKDF